MIFLTFGDLYSGVYQSQVIEVCEHLSGLRKKEISLIAFVPYTVIKNQKAIIKRKYSKAIILPMLPAHLNWWKMYIPLLSLILLFIHSKKIICRGTLACNIGLRLRSFKLVKEVIFDGRGAQAEEWKEYNIGGAQKIKGSFFSLEKKAVLDTDYRISVSKKLVEYWKDAFDYSDNDLVIIPCTIASSFTEEISINKSCEREKYGFVDEDIILVYSGSSAGWQSFELLDSWLQKLLRSNDNIKVLFLSNINDVKNLPVYSDFSSRIVIDWLLPEDVLKVLSICDYGILYREKSITNMVSSPTKFAEYLAAGLKVLISEGIGDYSEMIEENELGLLLQKDVIPDLSRVNEEQRLIIKNFAFSNFTKESYNNQYLKLLEENIRK